MAADGPAGGSASGAGAANAGHPSRHGVVIGGGLLGLEAANTLRLSFLVPERGAAALLPDGSQAAVFRTCDGGLYALSNLDPFSGAAVLSRGIVGDRGGVATVASPMHKQVFALATGICLDDEDVRVPVYAVRERDGAVEISYPGGDDDEHAAG